MGPPVQPEPQPEPKPLSSTFWLIMLLPAVLGMSLLTLAKAQMTPGDLLLPGCMVYLVLSAYCSLYCGQAIAERAKGSHLRKTSLCTVVSVGLFIVNIVLPVVGCCATGG